MRIKFSTKISDLEKEFSYRQQIEKSNSYSFIAKTAHCTQGKHLHNKLDEKI